ncbi:MAG TPA: shikimate dehydrogenase [Candidatus Acidoferrales bacterium]|jgi:3-dehydroquinate dehydratase/shikimate dehydrogenase
MIGESKICAVVAAENAATMWRQFERALAATKTIELRLDWLGGDGEIRRFLARLTARDQRRDGMRGRATLIATCRRREAGGRYRGTIAKQLVHLGEALRAGCEWYDLEIESASRCPVELLDVLLGEGRQICSAHFFQRAPKDLKRVVARLSSEEPDAIKIAAQCESLSEARRVMAIARGRRDAVVVPMGDVALPLRLLALREGGAFVYAPVENATAPGQVTLSDMVNLYRADRITRRTRVYGVIGNPIGHSLSPQLQNAGFQARKIDAVYLPFLVRDLKDFCNSTAALGMKGFSVTLPHKEAILRYLDACDELAAFIGAVNTVSVRGSGKLFGYNTDYVGVLRALERRMPLRGSRVLILGAGGVARAVAFALSRAGASVGICARRPARAVALARVAGGEGIARKHLRTEFFDAIVNATPVGMYPAAGQSPLEARELNCRLLFDTIYRPRATKLMQLAARRGIETVSGVEMFVAQGTAQWEIWTGQRAPEKVMRAAVVAALKREEKQQ